MPGQTFIEGHRVNLKTVEEEDVPFLQRGSNHPSLRRFATDTPRNRVQVRNRFEGMECDDDGICLLIVPSAGEFEDEPVGYIHVYPIYEDHLGGNLGVWLLPKAQRNKFLQDAMVHVIDHAFNQVGLRRITVETVDLNKPVTRACKRAGFTHEGTYRQVRFVDGEWRDAHQYGILRSEFPSLEECVADIFGPDTA